MSWLLLIIIIDVVILVEIYIQNIPNKKEESYPLDCELMSLFKIRRHV
jgi:hypothetical protein